MKPHKNDYQYHLRRVADESPEKLPGNVSEWPDYVFFRYEDAERDAARRKHEMEIQYERNFSDWERLVLSDPTVMMKAMYSAWRSHEFWSDSYLDFIYEYEDRRLPRNRDTLRRQSEIVVSKIREYFGIDLDEKGE